MVVFGIWRRRVRRGLALHRLRGSRSMVGIRKKGSRRLTVFRRHVVIADEGKVLSLFATLNGETFGEALFEDGARDFSSLLTP